MDSISLVFYLLSSTFEHFLVLWKVLNRPAHVLYCTVNIKIVIIVNIYRYNVFCYFLLKYSQNSKFFNCQSVSMPRLRSIEKGQKQKRRQRSSLLFGGHLLNSLPRYSYFAPGWFDERVECILFFISPWCNSSYSSCHIDAIHTILQIVPVQNS